MLCCIQWNSCFTYWFKSFELRKNAKVVTTPLTFIATASSILMNHLTPDFVDIDKYTNTIDLDLLESKLKKDKNIKAIIGVDYAVILVTGRH